MATDIETQLRTLGRVLDSSTTPVTVNDIDDRSFDRHIVGDTRPDHCADAQHARGHRRRWLLLSAAAVLLVAGMITSLALLGRSPDPLSPATSEVEEVPPASTTAPMSTQAPTQDGVTPTVPAGFIPEPEGPNDPRDAIQRFLGVPVDAARSAEWADSAGNRAVVECMATRGFVLDESTWRTRAFDLSSAEDQALSEALRGNNGCEEIANHQTNLLPDAETEYAELEDTIRADPRAVEAQAAVQRCIDNNRTTDQVIAPPECADVTGSSSQVYAQLSEEYAPTWIYKHRDMLEALRDRIAGYIERSGSPV